MAAKRSIAEETSLPIVLEIFRTFMANAASPQTSSRLVAPEREARIFWRIRWRSIRGVAAALLARSRLRLTLIAALCLLFWTALFILFRNGQHLVAVYPTIIEQLFNLFFLTLTALLIFSTAILLYSGLYRSREAGYLLTTPTSERRLFLHKFQEAAWFSCWGFFLLGSPMLVAYGVAAGSGWHFFAMIVPFMAAFAFIPTSVGAILCLIVVDRLPTVRRHAVFVGAVLAAAGIGWLAWQIVHLPARSVLTPRWFHELSQRLSVAEQSFLPSWWLTTGLLEMARTDDGTLSRRPWAQGIMFFALLTANALFFLSIAYSLAGRVYRRSFQSLATQQTAVKLARTSLVDRFAFAITWLFPLQLRHMIVKDVRLFRRDPLQWTQGALFCGLLVVYFFNVQSLASTDHTAQLINMVGFLNLAIVGLILSTFTSRFIFPMISLEGRRLWLLSRMPIRREIVLWSKFLFAGAGAAIPCCGLIAISDYMLPLPTAVCVIHQVDCLCLCFGLSGIAVGFGALFPSVREDSIAKIAAGFGGTVSLIVSSLFILCTILITAVPCHLYVSNQQLRSGSEWVNFLLDPTRALGVAAVLAIVLSMLAVIVPMRGGIKAFRRLEL